MFLKLNQDMECNIKVELSTLIFHRKPSKAHLKLITDLLSKELNLSSNNNRLLSMDKILSLEISTNFLFVNLYRF